VPRRGGGQHHQYLQPRGRGRVRRRHTRGRSPVRAAAGRSATAGVQAGCGRVPDRARRADGHGRRVRGGRRVRQAHAGERVKRLGVIGSMVWDTIYGRDPARPAIEEWGGISYSLAALDATLGDDWQIVPLVKVGRDLAPRANEFLGTLHHVAPGARFLEVPAPNNRVTLRYYQTERRCEQMSGGVPPWTWPELGPQVRDLDALYVNFISGYELDLQTARLLRRGRIEPDVAADPEGDPTGCGDVLGATLAASLLGGAPLEKALRLGTRMGARNVAHRGATGLRDHLLGRLSAV